ncbi:hypothetical protein [Lyngbya sp. PCC 8106]|uniref:hypothetical protein n=1 Tax=Lyngbya sp. (strain PCC 8106) TaxID=313612 RepID=UPI0000EAC768|nr:hypothetical protein [Lyngbya sp. PCC 8106]EAW38679.1 hypothetical protein L8106_14730 [Lyngbya sp. PCC 8106]
MRAYSQLADLETLLISIPDENIRAYAGEAVTSYSVGAYRSAIVSIWIAVIYDLYQKFRHLDEQFNDAAARQSITEINKIRNQPDKKQVSIGERTILDDAFKKVKMLTSTEYEHLNRIQQDRHRCAHPVLDDEGFLFQPSPELTRSHIRTAIETLLKQPPIIGKAATEALSRDVEDKYLLSDYSSVRNALRQRHLLQTSENYKQNLIKFCLKKILFLEPDEPKITIKYVWVLKCLIYEYQNILETIDKSAIESIITRTKDNRIQFLSPVYNIDSSFLSNTPEHIKEKFKGFLSSKDAEERHKAYIIHLFPKIKEEFRKNYVEGMSISSKKAFLNSLVNANILEKDPDFAECIIETNINIFSSSKSYSSGRQNAENYLKPSIPLLNHKLIEYLIQRILEWQDSNDQLIDCSSYMIDVFVETIEKFPETLPLWKKFLEEKKEVWGSMDNLEELIADAEKKYQ